MNSDSVGVSSELLAQITRRYGAPTVACLPGYGPDGDAAAGFESLQQHVSNAQVVLFAPVWPRDLDGFFRLRLTQVLAGQAIHPGLTVVMLEADAAGLAGGFSDRLRAAWPFAQSMFLTEKGDPGVLSERLGVPVGRLGDAVEMVSVGTGGQQKIALQLQAIWRGCGSTTAFENQVESLVRAGYLTIRLYTDGFVSRGALLNARLQQVIAEGSVHAGAHVNVLAAPDDVPGSPDIDGPDAAWAHAFVARAHARIRDPAVLQAAARATAVIANHLETVGLAVTLAPAARMVMDVHDDRAMSERDWTRLNGKSQSEILAAEAAAERIQALVMAIPDVCTHVSETELARLGELNPRSVLLLPRSYARPVPARDAPQFDVLLVGDEHWLNIRSLRWFLDAVWRPLLEHASVSVAIAGRAGEHVQGSAPQSPLLHFLGFVPDLEALRSACRITAVPDQGGTGVAVKTLTTLAVGHPLVTTAQGLRGLAGPVTRALPAYDDAEGFAADILALLRQPGRLAERQQLVGQAYEEMPECPDYAGLLESVPVLSLHDTARRQARWAEIEASTQPVQYFFEPDKAFLLSGGRSDRLVLGHGWHAPEPWGRWTNGRDASLIVELENPIDGLLAVELQFVRSPVGGAVALDIDGAMLPVIEPVDGLKRWDLPPALTRGRTKFQLGLHATTEFCPASIGPSTDTRTLGVRVQSVTLRRVKVPAG